MLMYCKVVDNTTKSCIVGIGSNSAYYTSLGMTRQEMERGSDGLYYLTGYAPRVSLEERKSNAIAALWRNYKTYQQRYVDPEDLTLAVVCASRGSAKGAAIQAWVLSLWADYYAKRDAVDAAGEAEELSAIDLSADAFGAPPYTIRELNEEARTALNN